MFIFYFFNTSILSLQISELEKEFANVSGERAEQTRYLRSQQELKQRRQEQVRNREIF